MNVTVDLVGGLGNQLFQIFATIAYALRYNLSFHFTNSEISGDEPVAHDSIAPRGTYWKTFFCSLAKFTTPTPYDKYSIVGFADHYSPRFTPLPPPPFGISTHLTLHGIFYHPEYFNDFEREVGNLIEIPFLRSLECSLFGFNNTKVRTIAIHFRIGDYKNLNGYFAILPIEYYIEALRQATQPSSEIVSEILHFRAVIFRHQTDSLVVDEHIRNLQLAFPEVEFIIISDNLDDWKQLLVMSCCSKIITANSSFSWWAAYIRHLTDNDVAIDATTVFYSGEYYGHGRNKNFFQGGRYLTNWKKVIWTTTNFGDER
jgi:hypothetical protein